MATILCLETATKNCSVTLSVNGSVVAFREDATAGYSHAERLHTYIDEVITEVGIDKDAISAIAISKGPGSYTGLRIGVSAAKGFCYALDIPLISIPTLDVLAQQVVDDTRIVSMLDARRMEVYSAVYNSKKEQTRETQAEILDESSFTEILKTHKTTFIGDGVEKFKPLVASNQNALFIENSYPSSKDMAAIAYDKFKRTQFEDVAYFEPYYLKDFKAG